MTNVRMYQQILDRRVADQVVREAGPGVELEHIAHVRIPEVGVDQQRRVVDLHREADGEIERNGRFAGALVGAGDRDGLPSVLTHLHEHLRAQQAERVGRRVVHHRRHAVALEYVRCNLYDTSARVLDLFRQPDWCRCFQRRHRA